MKDCAVCAQRARGAAACACGVQVPDVMKQLCTHIHVFKSWTAVGGKEYMM